MSAQPPASPRRAATVMLLREAGEHGVEILLVRRSRQARFMANSHVFPGGRVDDADLLGGEALASRRAASRELKEEVSVALPGPEALAYFSRWITPSVEHRRFDTDFFVAWLPVGQRARADEAEVFDLLWLSPESALQRCAEGTLRLPPPTLSNLEDLCDLLGRAPAVPDPRTGLAELLRERPIEPVLPKLVQDAEGGIAVVMPWADGFAALPGEGAALPRERYAGRSSRMVLTPEGIWRAS